MRIGLFGGSFDPVHNGHIQMAEAFVDALLLDKVIWMPTGTPPHKQRGEMAMPSHRLEMCRLATAAYPWAEVSDWEITQSGASFTVDTLCHLTAAYPDAQWYLLMGADMFVTLHSWHRFADIANMATLCAIPRDERDAAVLQAYADRLQVEGARCVILPHRVQAVSSTALREAFKRQEDVTPFVDTAVAEYIHTHRLYREEEGMCRLSSESQYIEAIRPRLSESRFAHSLAVADRAEELARKYGADPVLARTAGILHDIMKDTPSNVQLQIQKEFGILMDTVTTSSPQLWHAVTGAAFLEHVWGLDSQIIQAVRYHTTARAGMSLLEQVVYLADFTSADRAYPDVERMRSLSETAIAPAMVYALQYTIKDLIAKQRAIHPDTLHAYNEWIV